MIIPVTTLALAMQLSFTIADDVPRFNIEPLCRGIARQGGLDLEPNKTVQQDLDSCLKSEMAVRDQLAQQWATFRSADKTNCIAGSSAGGLPSYSGLLTCLQMARDAKKLGE